MYSSIIEMRLSEQRVNRGGNDSRIILVIWTTYILSLMSMYVLITTHTHTHTHTHARVEYFTASWCARNLTEMVASNNKKKNTLQRARAV